MRRRQERLLAKRRPSRPTRLVREIQEQNWDPQHCPSGDAASSDVTAPNKYVLGFLPGKAVAVRSTNLFNQNLISHFRDTLKTRQKHIFTDRFVVWHKFESKVSESELEVVELVTEPELEVV